MQEPSLFYNLNSVCIDKRVGNNTLEADESKFNLTVLKAIKIPEKVNDPHPFSHRPPPDVTEHGIAVTSRVIPDPSPPH